MGELDRPGLDQLHRRLRPGQSNDARWEIEIEGEGAQRHLDVVLPPAAAMAVDKAERMIRITDKDGNAISWSSSSSSAR